MASTSGWAFRWWCRRFLCRGRSVAGVATAVAAGTGCDGEVNVGVGVGLGWVVGVAVDSGCEAGVDVAVTSASAGFAESCRQAANRAGTTAPAKKAFTP